MCSYTLCPSLLSYESQDVLFVVLGLKLPMASKAIEVRYHVCLIFAHLVLSHTRQKGIQEVASRHPLFD